MAQLGDRIIEDVLRRAGGALGQDVDEIATEDLQLAAERLGRRGRGEPAEVSGAAGPNEAAGVPRDADAAVAYATADPGSATAGGGARERFVAAWGQVAGSLENPRLRALWAAQFEVLSLGATMPELVSDLSKMRFEAREGLAQLFGGVGPAADPEQVEEIGTLLQAILLGVVALNMFDPGSAPTGDQLARSLRTLADRVSPSA